jgi:hypothetical protein
MEVMVKNVQCVDDWVSNKPFEYVTPFYLLPLAMYSVSKTIVPETSTKPASRCLLPTA